MLVNDSEDEEGTPPSIDTDSCIYCTGKSAVWSNELGRHLTSKEYCELVTTCCATIDWDKIAERQEY